MIRRGKAEGWLTLTPKAFASWADLNEVDFKSSYPGRIDGRGAALISREPVKNDGSSPETPCLLSVPRNLILSLERVQEHAKVDRDFREVLESLGGFGRTPRGAILTFLLYQASTLCPDVSERFGVHGPFTDYIKSLPTELLPTFWTLPELRLLVGTTLGPAISSKLRSLHREYDLLCSFIATTRWHSLAQHHLDFDDWLHVDTFYRSRALEFPGIGHCMVPCLDLANHAPGDATVAIYEEDFDGSAVLLPREGKTLNEGDEVTITYGDEKGACEMLFSYGFLESDRDSAQTLFLSLNIPESDFARSAKAAVADCAPGFKIIDVQPSSATPSAAPTATTSWEGDYIYFLCITFEDGLDFQVARTLPSSTSPDNTPEKEELHTFFNHHKLTNGAAELHALLRRHELWPVYRLRAVAILQQRVFEQLQLLHDTQEDVEAMGGGEKKEQSESGACVRDRPYVQAMQLRTLEFELLERAYGDLETEKLELAESNVVQQYLEAMNDTTGEQEKRDGAGLDSQPPTTAEELLEEEDFS